MATRLRDKTLDIWEKIPSQKIWGETLDSPTVGGFTLTVENEMKGALNSVELPIGKVAKQFGVSVNTIRHYEERGLIGPLRRKETGYASKGYRIFTKQDIARLEFIRQARVLDLSLKQINELLESVDQGCCSSARPNLKELLEAKLREIEEKIEVLGRFHRQLKKWHLEGTEMPPESEIVSPCLPQATPSQCVFGIAKAVGRKERR